MDTENNNGSFDSTANDLMNMDMGKVDTGFPIIRPGVYTMQVAKMETVDSKSKANAKNLKIQLKLTETAQHAKTGETINAGFPINHTISLTPSEKYDPRKPLAQFMDGVIGNHEGSFAPIEKYIGQSVTVRLKVEPSDQYGDQNRVEAFIKKA